MKMLRLILLTAGFILGVSVYSAQAVPEIHWWHAMSSILGERVNQITANFNRSQSDYMLISTYKGNYEETLTAGIAAFRAGKPPHILQVFEVGTATMMSARGFIKPVYQLMAETGTPFDPDDYLGAVRGMYTTPDGKMLSMPFNSSTPVLFYNKDAFKKAGLDPEKPPKTWPEVAEAARKLITAGASKYGFTSTWPPWIHLENLSAWHNVPFGTKDNGFGGLDCEYVFNGPVQLKHLEALKAWQKEKIWIYGGRKNDAASLFFNGFAAMITRSSAAHAVTKRNAKFEFGVGNLPYWPDVPGAPQNSTIGGASLWVMAGHKAEEYKAVAAFFRFLSLPMVQAFWHEYTGYVPITNTAFQLMNDLGFYKTNPGRDLPIYQLGGKNPTKISRGLRFGNFLQMRTVLNEEMEAVWTDKKTPKQALDDAVKRGNVLLRKFEKSQK